jgi:hypothetical protein
MMPNAALADELTQAAEQLLETTDDNFITGNEVARKAGCNPDDPSVYKAFREIERRGTLRLEAWEGGMGLPRMIGLPR